MSKLLVVFGATGQQGGSLIDYVLDDAELSKQFTIRAITRDISSPAAQQLKAKNVSIVKADLSDQHSLHEAVKGAHTIFFMTISSAESDGRAIEFEQGKTIADAAVSAKAQYIIFSTLPNAEKISGGRYKGVYAFDVKADIEEYIRTLPVKSAFFAPGSFMQNFQDNMAPYPDGSGSYVLTRGVSPQTKVSLIDTAEDSGKYIGAILVEPEKYKGKTFCASSQICTFQEIVETMSRISGKRVIYQQVSRETALQYVAHMPTYGPFLVEMMEYMQDFGYYGPQSQEKVAWAVENARGKLNTLEEYLIKHPIPVLQ